MGYNGYLLCGFIVASDILIQDVKFLGTQPRRVVSIWKPSHVAKSGPRWLESQHLIPYFKDLLGGSGRLCK